MGMEYYDEYLPENDCSRIFMPECFEFEDESTHFDLYGYDEE